MSQIDISFQNSLSEEFNLCDTLKLDTLKNPCQNEEAFLRTENMTLQTQLKQLQFLLFQYQLTNQKMNEKIHENKILKDSVNTLELNINCLNEIIEIQSIELSRQDNTLTEYSKEIQSSEEKLEVLATELQENEFPICSKCSKNASQPSNCDNNNCCEQDIPCVVCDVNIYTSINHNEQYDEISIQSPSKKIQKLPKNKNQNKFRKSKRTQHLHSQKKNSLSHEF